MLAELPGQVVAEVALRLVDQARPPHQVAEFATAAQQPGHGLCSEPLNLYTHQLVSRGPDPGSIDVGHPPAALE
ncbi:hypothetical protein GCM10009016_25590 [Halomonas beimenensis]